MLHGRGARKASKGTGRTRHDAVRPSRSNHSRASGRVVSGACAARRQRSSSRRRRGVGLCSRSLARRSPALSRGPETPDRSMHRPSPTRADMSGPPGSRRTARREPLSGAPQRMEGTGRPEGRPGSQTRIEAWRVSSSSRPVVWCPAAARSRVRTCDREIDMQSIVALDCSPETLERNWQPGLCGRPSRVCGPVFALWRCPLCRRGDRTDSRTGSQAPCSRFIASTRIACW